MDAMRAKSSRSRRLSSRKQPGNNKQLDDMYPWDSFWDYMLDDSELDDTSRESILWWRMKKREASRLAAIRQEIPITRSTSTQSRRVATDFQSEEDPMHKTIISKSDLDREEDEVSLHQTKDQKEQADDEPHQLVYQHHPFSMESRDDDEDSGDEEAECEDEDVFIAQSLFRENSVRQSDSQYQEYQSRDDEDSDDEDDDDDMRPYHETPTSRQVRVVPSEGSSKWKKKWNPTQMLKKKKQQGHGNKIPKSFKTSSTRSAVDNRDDNTSSSTNTPPSLLVTHHMPTSNTTTTNNNNNNKQANFAHKASSKGWPLNTVDLPMSAVSTNVSQLPPPMNNGGIQDQGGTTRSSDEDKGKLEQHQAFAVVAGSKSSRPFHQKKNKRWSVSSSSRKQKFDVTPDEPAAALINSSIYKGYCRPRGLASLHKKGVLFGRNKHRGGVLSDGEEDDEILIAESAWLGVVNDGINSKSCAMDPAIALRPLQQPSTPAGAEPAKTKRRRRKGVLRSLYRSSSHDADDDEDDDDDEISLAESFLQPGHVRLFL